MVKIPTTDMNTNDETSNKGVRIVDGVREVEITIDDMSAFVSEKVFYQKVSDNLKILNSDVGELVSVTLNIPKQFKQLQDQIISLSNKIDILDDKYFKCTGKINSDISELKMAIPKKFVFWIKEKAQLYENIFKVMKFIAFVVLLIILISNAFPVLKSILQWITNIKM